MSLISRAVGNKLSIFNNYQTPQNSFFGSTSVTALSGERVDEGTALGISAVMGAVSLLADSVASMTLKAFKLDGNGNRFGVSLPQVLANPDPQSTSFELVHQMMTSLALHGNAYVHIDRDYRGNAIALIPLHPYQIQVLSNADQTGRIYKLRGTELNTEDVLHIRWFAPPQALLGISPLIASKSTIGLSLAMNRHLEQFYAEGATPSSVIETGAKELTPDQARVIRDNFEASHRRHRRVAVLSSGMSWKPVNASASDQQMIELRESVIRDVARAFRIPTHLLAAMGDNQTYTSTEMAGMNFLTYSIAPYLRRLELAFSQIIEPGLDVVFDTSTLLRSDALSRAKVNMAHVAMGARTPNEVRQLEGFERSTSPGMDEFHQSLAGNTVAGGELAPLGTDGQKQTPVLGILD